jgi:transposase
MKMDAESSMKVRVYPSKIQISTLKQWFGASRFIYNQVLFYLKNTKNPSMAVKFLREKFINNKVYETENKWMLDIPYDVRDEALRDLLSNYKSNFAKTKKVWFDISYRKKKQHNSMNILDKHWTKKTGLYRDVYKTWKTESHKTLPKTLKYTSRLIYTPLKEFFLCIPKPLKICSENQAKEQISSIVSLDPGVRTFLTGYDVNGRYFEIGKNDIARLMRLKHHRQKLQSKPKSTGIKKAMLRLSEKIQNLISDLHRKTSKWLCENYRFILIPKLNFHNFTRMRKKQKSRMAILGHCSFVEKLLQKQREYPSCNVKVVTEAYTSKTCTNCGNLKYNLGGSKTYWCKKCDIKIDRDVNGARNILLKYFFSTQTNN